MIAIIDTCSLLSLVRYYLPFDSEAGLYEFTKSQIENGEILIIDEVLRECQYTSKGIILQHLDYLENKDFQKANKVPFKTDFLLPPAPVKFHNQVDNQFINSIARNRLSDVEYESVKSTFLDSADARMIILCLNLIKDYPLEKIVLITEETEGSNDQKAFKKIPVICNLLGIKVLTLPKFLKGHDGFEFKWVTCA